MRNNPPLPSPTSLPARLPLQLLNSVEGAADFERAYALEVLALKVEAYSGIRLPFFLSLSLTLTLLFSLLTLTIAAVYTLTRRRQILRAVPL